MMGHSSIASTQIYAQVTDQKIAMDTVSYTHLGRGSVGNRDNPQNNRQIVRQIATLRGELARLLGHPNYATYRLKHRMCNSPEQVLSLIHIYESTT